MYKMIVAASVFFILRHLRSRSTRPSSTAFMPTMVTSSLRVRSRVNIHWLRKERCMATRQDRPGSLVALRTPSASGSAHTSTTLSGPTAGTEIQN